MESARLFHRKVDSVRPTFQFLSLLGGERLGGDDREALRSYLSGCQERIAHSLRALAGKLAHVVVACFRVLHHQPFHLRNGEILSQADQVPWLGEAFFAVSGFQIARILAWSDLNI